MIFLTVGTQFPFDRLVKTVDRAIEKGQITENVYAQIGDNAYQPHGFEAAPFLEKDQFDKFVQQASYVISHAGMGIITATLDNNKPLLAMPRQKIYNEVVNNHQIIIAKRFEQLHHILVAYNEKEFSTKINQLKHFKPKKRITQTQAMTDCISNYLNKIIL